MNKHLGLAVAAAMVFGFGCDRKPKSDEERAGYALGQQIGRNLKQQNVEVDSKGMASGMEDALKGKPSKLTDQELQEAMQKLQDKARQKIAQEGEKNKGVAQEYMKKHGAEADVKTTASGLQYKVVKAGNGKKSPGPKDVVKVHYTGTLTTGEKFDSSVDRGQPAEFPLNAVIPGWTEALKLMKVGDRYQLTIPPELAYGAEGRPGIPPYSVLIFDVELLDVKPGK